MNLQAIQKWIERTIDKYRINRGKNSLWVENYLKRVKDNDYHFMGAITYIDLDEMDCSKRKAKKILTERLKHKVLADGAIDEIADNITKNRSIRLTKNRYGEFYMSCAWSACCGKPVYYDRCSECKEGA
jgi:hypothetical protein